MTNRMRSGAPWRALALGSLALALGAVVATAAAQGAGGGAKDLFFGDENPALVRGTGFRPAPEGHGAAPGAPGATPTTSTTAPQKAAPGNAGATPGAAATTKPTSPGVRVWLTDANDASRRLSPQQTFRTGDRMRLSVQSNRDGHLYVVNVGTSGQTRVLFPRSGQDNRVQRFKDFSFNSPLVFSEPAGTEQLVVVLTSTPADEIPVAMGNGSVQRVSLRGGGSISGAGGQRQGTATRAPAAGAQAPAQGGGSTSGRDATSDSLDLALADLKGSKDLKFDDDGAELIAVSNSSESRGGSGYAPVVVNLRLTHRR